jgi:GR25 family glycosyltransferase involved in LPS biosynthesis
MPSTDSVIAGAGLGECCANSVMTTDLQQTPKAFAPFWGRLDGIAIINLDDRPERWRETLEELSPFPNIPNPTRISAVRGVDLDGFGKRPWFRGRPTDKRWAARAGCTQSHRKALLLAKARCWKTFLILEDDAELKPMSAVPVERLDEQLFERFPDWDICYLGFSKAVGQSLELTRFDGHGLCEVTGCYTTHAYLVRERARDWILNHLPEDSRAWAWHAQHRIIDRWYVRHLSRDLRVFAVTPSMITQRAGFSDIVQRPVNYDNEFDGTVKHLAESGARFRFAKRIHHAKMVWNDVYDGFRAAFKRINGF